MNPTTTDQRPLVVLVDDDQFYVDTRREPILKRFPDVRFTHCLTGIQLKIKLREGLRPAVVIMDYDLSKAGDGRHGAVYTRELKAAYPDLVVIGCCGPDNNGSITRRQEAFLKAGADAFINVCDGAKALLDELENWLPEEKEAEGKWRTGWEVATIGVMLALLWLVLLTAPQLVFSFYTLPVGAAVFVVFAGLFRTGRLPPEISVPTMGGALGIIILGWLFYLAATEFHISMIGGLLLGLLIYLIFTRR